VNRSPNFIPNWREVEICKLEKLNEINGCAGRRERTVLCAKFPVNRENTGKSANFGEKFHWSSLKKIDKSVCWVKIPYRVEQGIYFIEQGKIYAGTGKFGCGSGISI
jgi:hypothetical protein